jgi:hypothetical protein
MAPQPCNKKINGNWKGAAVWLLPLTKNKIRHINIIQQTECTLNNEINEKMVILEKFRKNIKFGLIMTKKYLLQHLIAD